jgi:hypothetical protein
VFQELSRSSVDEGCLSPFTPMLNSSSFLTETNRNQQTTAIDITTRSAFVVLYVGPVPSGSVSIEQSELTTIIFYRKFQNTVLTKYCIETCDTYGAYENYKTMKTGTAAKISKICS